MQFNLPDLGEGLAHATLVKWHVKTNDLVKIDQPVAAVETAKAIIDIPSPFSGTIDTLHAKEGEKVAVGTTLITYKTNSKSTIKAIPAARKLAIDHNLDLNTIKPKKGDTIRVSDVKAAIENSQNTRSYTNRTMANAMSQAQREVALSTVMNDAVVNTKPTDITSSIILAIRQSILKFPLINGVYDQAKDIIIDKSNLIIGIVVDTNENNQASIPCLNPSNKDLAAIRSHINQLKTKSIDNSFVDSDFQNPTIILSNYGSLGGRYATPMVKPPCLVTVGVGQLYSQLAKDNQSNIIERYHIPLSVSFDHRYLTGAYVIQYLKAMVDYLQCQ